MNSLYNVTESESFYWNKFTDYNDDNGAGRWRWRHSNRSGVCRPTIAFGTARPTAAVCIQGYRRQGESPVRCKQQTFFSLFLVCFFGACILNHVRHTTCKWTANFCVLYSGCLLNVFSGSARSPETVNSLAVNWVWCCRVEKIRNIQRGTAMSRPSGDGVGGHRDPSDGCGPNFLPDRKTTLRACCCGARRHGTKGARECFIHSTYRYLAATFRRRKTAPNMKHFISFDFQKAPESRYGLW